MPQEQNNHDWLNIVTFGMDKPGDQLDELCWCRNCGTLIYDQIIHGQDRDPNFPSIWQPGQDNLPVKEIPLCRDVQLRAEPNPKMPSVPEALERFLGWKKKHLPTYPGGGFGGTHYFNDTFALADAYASDHDKPVYKKPLKKLSNVREDGVIRFPDDGDGRRWIVRSRCPEDRSSGVTTVVAENGEGGGRDFIWDYHDPEVEYLGQGKATVKIELEESETS